MVTAAARFAIGSGTNRVVGMLARIVMCCVVLGAVYARPGQQPAFDVASVKNADGKLLVGVLHTQVL
jgi:hypothetical protein